MVLEQFLAIYGLRKVIVKAQARQLCKKAMYGFSNHGLDISSLIIVSLKTPQNKKFSSGMLFVSKWCYHFENITSDSIAKSSNEM